MSRKKEFEKDAVVFDWHGTLMDDSGKPRKKVVNKLDKNEDSHDIVILTASSDKEGAEEWLKKHDIEYDELVSRPKGAKGSDSKIKKSLLKKDVEPDYEVSKAYDDESKNIKMFKKQGIKAKKV